MVLNLMQFLKLPFFSSQNPKLKSSSNISKNCSNRLHFVYSIRISSDENISLYVMKIQMTLSIFELNTELKND